MNGSKLKERLKKGEVLIGTFIRSAEPAVAEVMAYAGFDFVVLDGEHSPLAIRELAGLMRAADGVDLPALVRVSNNAPFPILQALDTGASGVQVPQINSEEEAREIVASSKYFPEGNRGFAASQRSASHGFCSPIEYTKKANKETLVVSYIETKQAAEAAEDIAKIDGIDVLFCGPFDLSQSYGVPGETNHPDVQQALDDVVKACEKHNKAAGTIAGNAEQIKALVKRGFRYISYSSDLGMMKDAAVSLLEEARD